MWLFQSNHYFSIVTTRSSRGNQLFLLCRMYTQRQGTTGLSRYPTPFEHRWNKGVKCYQYLNVLILVLEIATGLFTFVGCIYGWERPTGHIIFSWIVNFCLVFNGWDSGFYV